MLQRSRPADLPGVSGTALSAGRALPLVASYLADSADRALLISGGQGLGKSYLLDRVAREHRARLIRALPTEQHVALSGLAAFLGAVLPTVPHELGTHLRLRRDDDAGRYAAAHDIRDLIIGLRLPPTVVLLDDIDLFDHDSASILATLLARLNDTNLRVVATANAPSDVFSALHQLRLRELSADDAERLALDAYPHADPTTVRLLLEYSGAHPLIWTHQLTVLTEAQLDGARPLRLPLTWADPLDELVPAVSRAVGESERQLLLDVALSAECHSGVLRSVHPGADAAVADLVDAGVLRVDGAYVSFIDQQLRSSLLHGAEPGLRRARHAALAEAATAHAPQLAPWHLSFLSTDLGLSGGLFTAAALAVADGRLHAGIELAERGFSRWSPTAPCPPAVVQLCWALQRDGETALATRYGTWALAARSEPQQVLELAAVRMVGSLSTGERLFDAEDEALVMLHGQHHRAEAVRLEGLAAAAHLERWEPDAARQALRRARVIEPELSSPIVQVLDGLGAIADALDGSLGPEHQLEAGHSAEELIVRARHLSLRERYADARRCLELALHHPSLHDRAWTGLAHHTALLNEIAAGDFHAARRAIDAWGHDAPLIWHPTSTSTWAAAWRHYSLGEVDAALATIDRCLDLAARESTPARQAAALGLRGTVHLMDHDVEAALADLRDTSVLSRDYPHPALLRHWGDYVEACLRADRPQEARRAVESFGRRMRDRHSRWGMLVLTRCEALLAPAPAATQQLAALVRSLDEGELFTYEGGRTLLCLARLQQTAGHSAEAQRTAATAATVFTSIGAVGWAEHARLLARAGEQSPPSSNPLDRLSRRDREIASLVHAGLRNREIAERLYLSLRTVELRLTHIYRTVGVSSRTELVALLGPRAA